MTVLSTFGGQSSAEALKRGSIARHLLLRPGIRNRRGDVHDADVLLVCGLDSVKRDPIRP